MAFSQTSLSPKKGIMLLLFLLFWVPITVFAQDYAQLEATIELYPTSFNEPEELSYFITRDFSTDEDKVRAIYTWIIQNVVYDPDQYKAFNYNFKNYRERNAKEEKTRIQIINSTIKNGAAVCEGYAMLFERLCELQEIQNYLVRGDIKTSFSDVGRAFKKVHMWNVIYIDQKPFLFDATWGAGRFNEKFIKEPSYYYYKAPPEDFIKTHYPEVFSDAFLTEDFSREQFATLPIIISKELAISDVVLPANGVLLRADYLGEINFRIRTKAPKKLSYSYGFSSESVKFAEENGEVHFSVPIEDSTTLLIYFDDQPVLGYKLK